MYHKDYVYQLKRTAPKENGVVCCFHRRDGEAAGCEIYAAERQGRLREKKEGGDSVALPSHECRQEIDKDIDIEKDIDKDIEKEKDIDKDTDTKRRQRRTVCRHVVVFHVVVFFVV